MYIHCLDGIRDVLAVLKKGLDAQYGVNTCIWMILAISRRGIPIGEGSYTWYLAISRGSIQWRGVYLLGNTHMYESNSWRGTLEMSVSARE